MLQKKIMIPVTVVAIGAAVIGSGAVFAQTSSNNPISGLAQAIAQKFNLNANDVQSTITQFRGQQMQQTEDKHLSNLVTQGKITNDQKTAIENELNQLKSKYNLGDKSQTPQQRKQNIQNFQNDFQAFLKFQGIDPTILGKGPGMGMLGKRGHGFGKWNNSPKPSASPNV